MMSIPISIPLIIRHWFNPSLNFYISGKSNERPRYINTPATYSEVHMLTVLLRAPRESPKPAPQNEKICKRMIIQRALQKFQLESINTPILPKATGNSCNQIARNVAKAALAYVVKTTPMNIPSKNFSITKDRIIM